jgi:hypothetical protein
MREPTSRPPCPVCRKPLLMTNAKSRPGEILVSYEHTDGTTCTRGIALSAQLLGTLRRDAPRK